MIIIYGSLLKGPFINANWEYVRQKITPMNLTKFKIRQCTLLFLSVVLMAGLACNLSSCNSTTTNAFPGSWDQLSDFAGIPRDGAVGFVINNIAYVGTGYSSFSSKYLNDFWKYDPNSDSWFPVAPFPGQARENAVAFSLNGKGYVGTGYNIVNGSNNPMSDFWEFDPAAGPMGAWNRIADFGYTSDQQAATVSARYQCAAFTVKNRAFVGWGEDIGQFGYKDLWEYDQVNNFWIQRPDAGSKRINPFVFVIDDLAYVGGGYDPGSQTYPVDIHKFDVTQLHADGSGNPWSAKNRLTGKDLKGNAILQPHTRQLASTFSINGLGYITMGDAGGGDTWQYDPVHDTWLQFFSMTTNTPIAGAPRSSAIGFTVNINGTDFGILTTGGNGTKKLDDCWKFNPAGNEPDNQ